jgi:glycosyltransferase involved in cell wall biosynthesis
LTRQPLELALFLRTERDMQDRLYLESQGWRVRLSREVAATPELYQSFIQGSRGEFSCAKPSYVKLQTGWISDRTACYLASGKPVVVQDTGPSAFLPNGEGMFRFSTVEEAVDALACINANYERHCRAARQLAETYFDARRVVTSILSQTLHPAAAAKPAIAAYAPGLTACAVR